MLLNSKPQIILNKEFHLTPGRLRLRVPNLKRNTLLAGHLNECLAVLPGVKSIQANPNTGRALVRFEPASLNWRALVWEIYSACRYFEKHLPAVNSALQQGTAFEHSQTESCMDPGHAEAAAALSAPATACEYRATNNKLYAHKEGMPWHVMHAREAVAFLDSNTENGLSTQDVQQKRRVYGPNEFVTQSPPSLLSLLLEPLKDFMTRLLLGAAGVSLLLGEFADALP